MQNLLRALSDPTEVDQLFNNYPTCSTHIKVILERVICLDLEDVIW